jgi:hypothetical protein
VSDKVVSIAFYEKLGFELITVIGFKKGHPIIMQHQSGDVLNLLGPADETPTNNILMDIEPKHAGLTHVSYKVKSVEQSKEFLRSIDMSPVSSALCASGATENVSNQCCVAIFRNGVDLTLANLEYRTVGVVVVDSGAGFSVACETLGNHVITFGDCVRQLHDTNAFHSLTEWQYEFIHDRLFTVVGCEPRNSPDAVSM